MRVTHLNKSGSGFTSKTACGRNIMRTPISVNWIEYKNEPMQFRCIKCESSKQVAVNKRTDEKKLSSSVELV